MPEVRDMLLLTPVFRSVAGYTTCPLHSNDGPDGSTVVSRFYLFLFHRWLHPYDTLLPVHETYHRF